MASMFTLAPADHETDPTILETGYKVWSTYRRDRNAIHVRSNNPSNAGGQVWSPIAQRSAGIWRIEAGSGYLNQGGMLLTRYLIDSGERVRSAVAAYAGPVRRYRASHNFYSLPTILNGRAVVSRDAEADKRAAKRKMVDFATAMEARATEARAAAGVVNLTDVVRNMIERRGG